MGRMEFSLSICWRWLGEEKMGENWQECDGKKVVVVGIVSWYSTGSTQASSYGKTEWSKQKSSQALKLYLSCLFVTMLWSWYYGESHCGILLHICTARCVATSSLLHDSLHHRARKFTVLSDVHMLWIGMQVGWAKGDRALLPLWAAIGQPIVHASCGLWDNCWMQSKFVNVFWTLYFFTLTGNVCKCYCS